MASTLGSAFVDGVLRGGIPLGLALNNDARAKSEQEHVQKLQLAQEKRAQEAHGINMQINQENFLDAQAVRQTGMLQGLYDAHQGDMGALVRSPQGGVLLAQMLQNDPKYAEQIATNPGFKAASFVPTADGKEFMLMLQSEDGRHAPLTANRAAGGQAVKFTESQLMGVAAQVAGRVGKADPMTAQRIMEQLNVQDMGSIDAAASLAIQPSDIPAKPNLGAVAAIASTNNSSNFTANGASAKTIVESPIKASAPLAKGAPATMAEGTTRAGETMQPEELQALAAEEAKAGINTPAETAQPTAAAAPAGMSSSDKRNTIQERLTAQKNTATGLPFWKTGTPISTKAERAVKDAALEAEYVAAAKKANEEVAPAVEVAKKALLFSPLKQVATGAMEAAGAVGDFLTKSAAGTRAAMEKEQLRKAGVPEPVTAQESHKKNAEIGVASTGAYADEDIAGEGVADNRAGYKVQTAAEPQNKAEKAVQSGAVPARAMATPEAHAQVAASTEGQIRTETLPQRVHNDGIALRTLQGAAGGRITARQRYAALRAHQTGLISDSMYANYMQSGRFSFEDVHAAVAVQNLRLSAMRIQQDAMQSERNFALDQQKLQVMQNGLVEQRADRHAVAMAGLDTKQREMYDYNVKQVGTMVASRARIAQTSILNNPRAAKFFGATDAKGFPDADKATKISESMIGMVLQDPLSRQLITGDKRAFTQITPNDVDRAVEVMHAFVNDSNTQQLFSNGGIMSDGNPGSINASAGSFISWIASDPQVLRKQNAARSNTQGAE